MTSELLSGSQWKGIEIHVFCDKGENAKPKDLGALMRYRMGLM